VIPVYHYGRKPSRRARDEAQDMLRVVDRLVFGGALAEHVACVSVHHTANNPPGERPLTWLSDGLRGMYDERTLTVRTCLKSFYGTWLWGVAHDLVHVHDIVSGNLVLHPDGTVSWMGQHYTPQAKWGPGTRGSRAPYEEFGTGVVSRVIQVADEHVPWEVKPSVMAEVCLMELRGQQGDHRRNRA
jgi:hypothetical protein